MTLDTRIALLAVLAVVASGCGNINTICEPGRQVSCSCPGGEQGAQACLPNGGGFSPCHCPSDSTSASSGAGGMGGMGGGTGGQSGICIAGSTKICYDGPLGTENVGLCKAGVQTCSADGKSYGSCVGEVLPKPDDCATPADDDCNGSPTPCLSNSPWSKRYGTAGQMSIGEYLAVDAQGNIVLLADLADIDLGNGSFTGAAVIKLDSSGNLVWSHGFGGPTSGVGGVAVDGQGNVLITGWAQGPIDFGGGALPSGGVFLAKLSPQGVYLWGEAFGMPSQTLGMSIAASPTGDVFLGGKFAGTIDFGGGTFTSMNQNGDLFVAKFDPTGKHLWSKQGHTSGGATQRVSVDGSGNVVITGWFNGQLDLGTGPIAGAGGGDIFVTKLDGSGKPIYVKGFGDAQTQSDCRGAADAAGNVVLVGSYSGTLDLGGGALSAIGGDAFFAKLDAQGKHMWSQSFGNGKPVYATGAAVDAAGNVFLTGGFENALNFGAGKLVSNGSDDIFIAKYAPSGTALWTKRFGDAQLQIPNDVKATPLGAPILTGWFAGSLDFGTGAMTAVGKGDLFLAVLPP